LEKIKMKVHLDPPSVFWCLNDKTIKELMSFAKCETGKYLMIMLKLFIHQDIRYVQYDFIY
jgi:hypothetical protein